MPGWDAALFGVCCVHVRYCSAHVQFIYLDSLPEKPPRSRLEPYRELIWGMRRRGRPLREIVQVLGEKCGVHVVHSTIHDFVKATHSTGRNELKVIESFREQDSPQHHIGIRDRNQDEVGSRISALRAKKAPYQEPPERFRFDSGEPIRLRKPPESSDGS